MRRLYASNIARFVNWALKHKPSSAKNPSKRDRMKRSCSVSRLLPNTRQRTNPFNILCNLNVLDIFDAILFGKLYTNSINAVNFSSNDCKTAAK